ncbi:MAG: hypothetical protein EAX81_04865 [Candidatus Thorarchaeota archaeon]|nr:hypothetical protein [Candidatus Thorarchaeota archaeon]
MQAARVKRRDDNTCQACGWTEREAGELGVHHIKPLEDWEGNPHDYPDELLCTLCKVCHTISEAQGGEMKWPINGRGEDVKYERLNNPEWRQSRLPEFSS